MEEQEFFELDYEEMTQEEMKKFKASINKLKKRCEKAGIEVKENKDEYDDLLYIVKMPAGREKRLLIVTDKEDADNILKINFEKYVFLDQYLAICSYEDGTIEAILEPLSRINTRILYKRLFGIKVEPRSDVKYDEDEITINQPTEAGSIEIHLGYPTLECQTLVPNRTNISLKIKGLSFNTHDKALSILDKLASAVLFQIDLAKEVSLALARDARRPLIIKSKSAKKIKKSDEYHFPTTCYDLEPLSLYWYAKSAVGIPLLQFLAYYQSVEFYFPVYAEVEAKKVMKNVLKDPTFNKYSDSDLTKLLNAIRSKMGKGFESERLMLKATLTECLDVDQLREFLKWEDGFVAFFSSNQCKDLSKHKIKPEYNDAELISSIMERIYEIRCKIVHTKAGDSKANVDLLLPFSKEVENMYYDIELMKYISQQVIIASGSPLNL